MSDPKLQALFDALMALRPEERTGLCIAVLTHDPGALMCAGRALDDPPTRAMIVAAFLPPEMQDAFAQVDAEISEKLN